MGTASTAAKVVNTLDKVTSITTVDTTVFGILLCCTQSVRYSPYRLPDQLLCHSFTIKSGSVVFCDATLHMCTR